MIYDSLKLFYLFNTYLHPGFTLNCTYTPRYVLYFTFMRVNIKYCIAIRVNRFKQTFYAYKKKIHMRYYGISQYTNVLIYTGFILKARSRG